MALAGLLSAGLLGSAWAENANAPSLVISQLKITSSNGQFITLYNSTNSALDMSKYQLQYFNHYDLSKASSSKLIALSGIVPPHGYFMVNDASLLLCYRLSIESVSLGLSSTAGMVEVLAFNQTSPGSSVVPVLQDYVGWSKTAASGAQTLPTNTNAFLQRLPVDVTNNPSVMSPGAGSWQSAQPDPNNACNLISGSSSGSTPVPSGLSQLLPSTEPPVTVVGQVIDDSTAEGAQTATLPASDIGLMAPKITEILPNPIGTGNDASDEFIELYNPNDTDFDLTGFGLQVGTTTVHKYTFASGTTLSPHSFKAFYASITGLSLSNSGGQAKLLDPFGNSISASNVYTTAKDGQAWALANGKWYWTTKLTPDLANIIIQPVSTKKTTKTTSSKNKVKSTLSKTKSAKAGTAVGVAGFDDKPPQTPIHPWILALIGVGALLYGAYEYRADLANKIFELKRYLAARRANRT